MKKPAKSSAPPAAGEARRRRATGEGSQAPPATPSEAHAAPSMLPDHLQALFAPWNAMANMWSAWAQTTDVLSRERGLEATKLMTRFWDPEFWKSGGLAPLLDEIQHIFSLPRFADMPTLDMTAIRSSASALDLIGAAQRFLSVSVPLWMAISKNFQAEVSARAEKGEDVNTPGEALDLWNNVVDRTFMEFNRSGDFADLQQRLLRALTQYRLELRKLGERTSELLDMPSRREMTDIYGRLHGMQRELIALRRELRGLRRGKDTPIKKRSSTRDAE